MATKPQPDQAQPDQAATTVDLSYRVLGPIQHDGDSYVSGDLILLPLKSAQPLLAIGAIAAPDQASERAP